MRLQDFIGLALIVFAAAILANAGHAIFAAIVLIFGAICFFAAGSSGHDG